MRTHFFRSKSITRLALWFFSVPCFTGLSLFVNAIYIFATTQRRGIDLLAIQMSLIAFTFFYVMYALPIFLTKFFANNGTKLKFVLMYSVIIGVLDMIIPLIATLFTDPLCFNHLIVANPESTTKYSFKLCSAYDFFAVVPFQKILVGLGFIEAFCGSATVHENKLTFSPVPNYSSQCRNASFKNFLPIVMYSSLFMTMYRLSYYLCRFSRK